MGGCCSAQRMTDSMEAEGRIYEAQKDRSTEHQYSSREMDEEEKRTTEFLQLERRLREIAQRQLAIAAETKNDSFRPESMSEELETLNAAYFIADQKRTRLIKGFNWNVKSGLECWRKHTDWYFHRVLSKDCATRGGCCARGCGCCRSRKFELGSTRQSGLGHCTVECGCCLKAHGWKLTEQLKEELRNLYPLDPEKDPKYYRKIMLASIFGLADGCHKNPMDLIEDPSDDFLGELPAYEEPESVSDSEEGTETTVFDVNRDGDALEV